MEPCVQRALTDYLGSFIAAPRRARIEVVLAQRTRYLTLMLEDIYQSHNASAVLRSAECFGIQELHVVESRNVYQVNRDIALGASQAPVSSPSQPQQPTPKFSFAVIWTHKTHIHKMSASQIGIVNDINIVWLWRAGAAVCNQPN